MRVTQLLARARASWKRRSRRDDGVTVMEIIVAMTIIGGVMASASLFFIGGLRNTGGQSQRQLAVTLANQKLESVQSISPQALITGRDCNTIYTFTHTTAASTIVAADQIAASLSAQSSAGNCDTSSPLPSTAVLTTENAVVNGLTYTMDTYIDVCWLVGSMTTGNCGATNTGGTLTKMYRVSVDVSYTPTSGLTCSGLVTGRCDYVATTLVDPSNDPTFNSNISVPKVTAVSPTNLLLGTTKSITLTGSNFVNGIAVSIASTGGIVTAITANTGTSLTFTLQASSTAGSYTITLLNPDGGTTTTSITVNPLPNITSVSPNSVTPSSTTTMTLNGTGFQSGATIGVDVGAVASATWISSTQMTVSYTATSSSGTRTFTVTNPDTGSDTQTFTVKTAPNITGVSPAAVGAGTTQTLTLTGTGFVSGATLTLAGGGSITGATWVSATQMTVSYTASGGAGSKTLTLTNPDGGTDSQAFTVNAAPTVSSVTSLSCTATPGNLQTLTVSGTGLVAGATVTSSANDTFSALSVSSSTSATVKVLRNGATAGNRTLTWTNADGGVATYTWTATNCSAPTISTVSPNTSPLVRSGGSITMTLTSTNGGFLYGASVTVTKSGSAYGTVSNVNVVSTNTITFTWTMNANSTASTYTYTVTQDGDTAQKTSASVKIQ